MWPTPFRAIGANDPGSRDAPTTATTTRTVMRTAVGLIIPTILLLATVFGEVYTERFLDALLPKPANPTARIEAY